MRIHGYNFIVLTYKAGKCSVYFNSSGISIPVFYKTFEYENKFVVML